MNGKIYICVFFLKSQGLIEAIKKEALFLFSHLQKSEFKNKVELISIEPDNFKSGTSENINCIAISKFDSFIVETEPVLIHLFIPFLKTAFYFPNLFNFQVLITASGGNPLFGINNEELEILEQAVDSGNLYIITQSKYSSEKFFSDIFREVFLIYPPDLIELPQKNSNKYLNKKIKIGFASSPFIKEDYIKRGIHIIKKIAAKHCGSMEFVILWRNPTLKFYSDSEIEAENIEIKCGVQDIKLFYESIDILFVPYTD
ncbi:hypothetical protein KA977_10200, partial [Candidatus Dependentiae bacterium]|nr:hypothetical protein [Candidatus Dependentiae bacterium]